MKIANLLGNLLDPMKSTLRGEEISQDFLDFLFLLLSQGESSPQGEALLKALNGYPVFETTTKGDGSPATKSEEAAPLLLEEILADGETPGQTITLSPAETGSLSCEGSPPEEGTKNLFPSERTRLLAGKEDSAEKKQPDPSRESFLQPTLLFLRPFHGLEPNGSPLETEFPDWLEKIFSAPKQAGSPSLSSPIFEGEEENFPQFSPSAQKEVEAQTAVEEDLSLLSEDKPGKNKEASALFGETKRVPIREKEAPQMPEGVKRPKIHESAEAKKEKKIQTLTPEKETPRLDETPGEAAAFRSSSSQKKNPHMAEKTPPSPPENRMEHRKTQPEGSPPDLSIEQVEGQEEISSPPGSSAHMKEVSLSELPEFVKELVVKTHPEGKHEARLKLHPPELGEMHLSVSVDRGEVKLLLTVEHPRAAEMVSQHLHQLELSLQELGLQFGGAEINLAGGNPQYTPHKNHETFSQTVSLRSEGPEEVRQERRWGKNSLIDILV